MPWCSKCGAEKPTSNFASKGPKRKGEQIIGHYTDAICRSCLKAKRKANGQCPTCCRQLLAGEKSCEKCKEAQRISVRKRMRLDKLAAIRHYGGEEPKCVWCSERLIEFLTIDHIANNGHIDKAEHLYAKLRKSGYPSGYQVLCFGCNSVKGAFGYNPRILTAEQLADKRAAWLRGELLTENRPWLVT